MDNIILYTKLSTLPDHLRMEVSDFVDFLMSKSKNSLEKKKPQFGSGKGMFTMKKDFDLPLEDFKDYM